MKKYLLGASLILASSWSFGQYVFWGTGGSVGAAHAEFQAGFIQTNASSSYDANSWTARTVNDGSGTNVPGSAFWNRTLLGYSQGVNSDGLVIGSPSQANGVAIFDSDYLDNGGVVGNQGGGTSPAHQKGELISPRIDFTGYTDSAAIVKFFLKYSADSINELSLSFSVDDGLTWGVPKDLRGSHANNVEGYSSATFTDELAGVTNMTSCRLKFTFDGAYNYAMVDDIAIHIGTYYWGVSNMISFSTVSEISCTNSYTSPSGNYTWNSPGVYYDTIPNHVAFDSLITIHLSFGTPTTGIDVQSTCGPYTWMDGNDYTQSNSTATHTILNASGCDSVVTLNLTVNTLDISTSLSNYTITSNEMNGSYRWLDCDNNYAMITGETNQSFVPTVNGSYAVEVTINGCVDTSACILIDAAGIGENDLNHLIKVYPNPTEDVFIVEGDFLESADFFQIVSADGRLVYKSTDANHTMEIDASEWERGLYFMNVASDTSKITLKLIKK